MKRARSDDVDHDAAADAIWAPQAGVQKRVMSSSASAVLASPPGKNGVAATPFGMPSGLGLRRFVGATVPLPAHSVVLGRPTADAASGRAAERDGGDGAPKLDVGVPSSAVIVSRSHCHLSAADAAAGSVELRMLSNSNPCVIVRRAAATASATGVVPRPERLVVRKAPANDNGGATPACGGATGSQNFPLRGGKCTAWEV